MNYEEFKEKLIQSVQEGLELEPTISIEKAIRQGLDYIEFDGTITKEKNNNESYPYYCWCEINFDEEYIWNEEHDKLLKCSPSLSEDERKLLLDNAIEKEIYDSSNGNVCYIYYDKDVDETEDKLLDLVDTYSVNQDLFSWTSTNFENYVQENTIKRTKTI